MAALSARIAADVVEEAEPASWFVAGARPAYVGLAAFWLDIKITAGTNVKDETASFVAAVFEDMRALLGPVHEESYVLVHAVDGDAYGYGYGYGAGYHDAAEEVEATGELTVEQWIAQAAEERSLWRHK